MPLYRGQKGETVTQYSMKTIEKDRPREVRPPRAQDPHHHRQHRQRDAKTRGIDLDLSAIPLDDPETYKLLTSGNTSGVFQLESRGMRELLARLKPSQFEDIIAINALYRPGPPRERDDR